MHSLSEAIRGRLRTAELEKPETFGTVRFPSHGVDVREAHHRTVRVDAARGREGSEESAKNGYVNNFPSVSRTRLAWVDLKLPSVSRRASQRHGQDERHFK